MSDSMQYDDFLRETSNILKASDGIQMYYHFDYDKQSYMIRLSVDGYHVQEYIPYITLEHSPRPRDTLSVIIVEMLRKLKMTVSVSPTTNVYVGSGGGGGRGDVASGLSAQATVERRTGGGGYSNATTRINPTREVSNMSIPLPDGWLSEELNMTKAVVGFDKTDRDRILHIKKLFRDLYNLAFVSSEDIAYIAGGAFTSLWYYEVPRDIDLFFINNTEGFDILNNPRFKVTLSEYMSNPNIKKVVLDTETNIQYIYTNYASREQLINHFDMMHCCVSYDFKEDKLYISPAVLDTIKRKIIRPNGQNKVALWRSEKMIKRGWKNEAVGI